jgi:hypothetical protein
VQLRYNYRLYPTPGQEQALARAFGCARVVFNDGLRARQDAREAGADYIKDTRLQRRVITEAKQTPDQAWLAEVSSVVLVQALADLHTAYRNFFNSVTGKRKSRTVAPPRLRSRKDNRQAIRFTRNGFTLRPNSKLYLAKIGEVAVRWSRPLPSASSSVTISRSGPDPAGKVSARRRLVSVRGHAGVQGRPGRPVLRSDRPVGTHVPGVLGLRGQRRTEAPVGPVVDLPGLRHHPRPGSERCEKHPGRRTGGQVKRLWRTRKNPERWGGAR